MPTVFDSHFAAAGFPMLLSNFGESITYLPNGGGERPIQAIVDRDPPAILDAAGNAVVPQFIVRVSNSCRSGISSRELDTGKDQLRFTKRIGEAIPVSLSIGMILSQDAGVVQLAVM
jgi:hypothetical protein